MGVCRGRRRERRALAARCEIVDLDGLTRPLVFTAWGQPPRIYLPAGWTGPFRQYAILAMVDEMFSRGVAEEERLAIWQHLVGRIVGPLGDVAEAMRPVAVVALLVLIDANRDGLADLIGWLVR